MPSHNVRTGKTVSAETLGAIATTKRREVEPQSNPDSGFDVIQSIVSPAEEGQGHGTLDTLYFDTTSGQGWPTLVTKRRNERGDEEVTTIVRTDPDNATDPLSLTTRRIEQTAETADRAVRSVSVVASHATLYDFEYVQERAAGARGYVKETIITPPALAAAALPSLTAEGTVDARIEKIDSGASRKTETILLEAQPTLPFWEFDQRTGLPVLELRKIINTSDVPLTEGAYNSARTALSLTAKDTLEYRALDKWLSVQIVSKIPATIDPTVAINTYVGTANYSFPNILTEDGTRFMDIWAAIVSGTSVTSFDHDVALHCEIIEGYSGPCKALYREYLTSTPDTFYTDNPTLVPTQINPQAYKIEAGVYAVTGTTAQVSMRTWDIPETIHNSFIIGYSEGGSTPPGSGTEGPQYIPDVELPATTPVSTPPKVILAVEPEKWRSGIYLMKVVTVYHPGTTTPDGNAITFP